MKPIGVDAPVAEHEFDRALDGCEFLEVTVPHRSATEVRSPMTESG